jgi:hypothetical protein
VLKVFPIFFIFFCATLCVAQDARNIWVDVPDNGKILSELLSESEKKYDVDFIYDEKTFRALTSTRITERTRLLDYLKDYLPTMEVVKIQDNVVAIVNRVDAQLGMRKENYIVLKETPSDNVFIEGIVTDARTGEPLIGAHISVTDQKKAGLADIHGDFRVTGLNKGLLWIEVSYQGYETGSYMIGFSRFGKAEKISATLAPASIQLESVTITSTKINENVTSQLSGVAKLSIETIKATPAFMGEVDPIRSLTTLPGVSTPGELASGFNVRGGETGQNLILQDGATIYNPSHLFGFFSAFNPDMVSGVTLYKGGPANFGGRISSVLDVSLKNGDAGKSSVSGGFGTISSRLSAEGPLKRNKSSYVIGGRVSYCNWLVKATDDIRLQKSSANFYDVTAKVFQTINKNNFLTFSIYNSYDAFSLATDSVFSWGSQNYAFKWDHVYSEKLFSYLSVASSNYFSEVQSNDEIDLFTYRNSIKNLVLKYDLTYAFNDESKLMAGVESSGSVLEPGKLVPAANAVNVQAANMNNQRALESAVYVQADFELSPKWSLSAGLRYSYFLRLGEDEIYEYDYNNVHGRYPAITDTVGYANGEVVKKYSGLEPRLSARYMIGKTSSLKASFFRGYQYMHQISNTTTVTPQAYWVASGPYLQPEIGNQFSLGYFQNLKDNRYELSFEGFYKKIENAVDYIEGADITLNPALEAGLSQGKGLAYGVEALLKQNTGRLNGWLAFTYSRSLRQFDNSSNIVINNGDYYASTYDQPYHISLVLNYQISPRTIFSTNFNYSTGRPITIPVSKFSYEAYLAVLNYSKRNEYRIPDYHRLDFSLTIKDNPKKNKRVTGEWVFSIFNVYGRKNTYSISFNSYGTAQKLSVLGTVFPSVTYNFKI